MSGTDKGIGEAVFELIELGKGYCADLVKKARLSGRKLRVFILLRQHIDAHIKPLIHVLRDQIRHRGSVTIAVISVNASK